MTIKSTLMAIACLGVLSFAALPEIRVTTKGNQNPDGNSNTGGWGAPTTTYNYFAVDKIELTDPNNSRNNLTSNTTSGTVVDSIKVRGNSTAGQAKKPYRIKFKDKYSLFGKEEAKSWVLLANYYDATFSLNAIAFELGKKMGLEFTNSSQQVDLYINGTYKGIYQLTEQIQSHKGRVDLKEKHNGWLVEFDYHPADNDDRLSKFTSSKYNLGTFIKSPELDDTSFTKNKNDSTSLRFVKTDINNLVNKMYESGFPTNGYRDLIDLESFAKYVLIQLFMDNFDFNSKAQSSNDGGLLGSNYAYKIESCGRIKAGPLWDFDLAAGVTVNGFAKHYQAQASDAQNAPITPTHSTYSHAFYKRLWADPVFQAKYKKAWVQHKSAFQAISSNGGFIDNIKSQVESSVNKCNNNQNCNQWANNSSYGSTAGVLTPSTFSSEVSSLKTWWNNRINFADQQFNSISESGDITQEPLVCNTGSSSSKANTVSSSSTNNGSVSSSSTVTTTPSSSSANNSGSVTLTCTGLQASVEKGGTIAVPTLTCSNGSIATNENWFGRPSGNTSWTTNAASTTTSYIIRLTATCGTVSGLEASCGTVAVGDVVPIKIVQIANSNAISIMHNSINLQVQSTAKLYLYNLNGKLQKSMFFGSGVYNVPLGDLPKGMYVMQARLGNEKKIQRFVVK